MKKWLYSGRNADKPKSTFFGGIRENNHGKLFFNIDDATNIPGGFFILDGYIIPRNHARHFQGDDLSSLLAELLNQFGKDWILHVKGIFTIVIFWKDEFYFANDHLALNKIYWQEHSQSVSNCFNSLSDFSENRRISLASAQSRVLFHRDIGEITPLEGIYKTRFGCQIWISDGSLNRNYYFDPHQLLSGKVESRSPEEFALSLDMTLKNLESYYPEGKHYITLTGGKDARTGLAFLRSRNKEVIGFTYGNPDSKDAVFARKIAQKATVDHVIPDLPHSEDEWIQAIEGCMEVETTFVNIHRAYRYHAFKSVFKTGGTYWAGYMGGEWLMGLYEDALVFPKWLTDLNHRPFEESILNHAHFYGKWNQWTPEIQLEIDRFTVLAAERGKKGLLNFELMFQIGVLHHQQDIVLSQRLGARPFPFFMDIDVLDLIFTSQFSFFNQNNQSKNLFKRWGLYELNIRLQHMLMPNWDHVPYGKKGSYTPFVYLLGPILWGLYKTLHYLLEKKDYPPNFIYPSEWRKVITDMFYKMMLDTESAIHSIFDTHQLWCQLQEDNALLSEKDWKRYSTVLNLYVHAKI